VDAGAAAVDAGALVVDSRTTVEDAETAEVDAGVAVEDARAVEVDAAAVVVDARAVEVDARAVEVDARAVEVDAGAVVVEAGAAVVTMVGNVELSCIFVVSSFWSVSRQTSTLVVLEFVSVVPPAHISSLCSGSDAANAMSSCARSSNKVVLGTYLRRGCSSELTAARTTRHHQSPGPTHRPHQIRCN
jgi:hypothetical protein